MQELPFRRRSWAHAHVYESVKRRCQLAACNKEVDREWRVRWKRVIMNVCALRMRCKLVRDENRPAAGPIAIDVLIPRPNQTFKPS